MGATTDYGSLHSALKRRFEAHDFGPATIEELKAILAWRTTVPAEPEVIPMIVSRTHFRGAPWEGLGLLKLATESARSQQGTTVNVAGDSQRQLSFTGFMVTTTSETQFLYTSTPGSCNSLLEAGHRGTAEHHRPLDCTDYPFAASLRSGPEASNVFG